MKNSLFFYTSLFLLFSLMPLYAVAQFSPGKKDSGVAIVEYQKVNYDDTLRVRKSKVKPKKKKKKTAVGTDSLQVKKKKEKKKSKEKVKAKKEVSKKRSKGASLKKDSIKYEVPVFRLGDRVIMRGDSGADVRQVARILVKKLYMDEDSIIYTESGEVLYDGELYRSVKRFQRLNDMHDDGIIGPTLIKALRKRK